MTTYNTGSLKSKYALTIKYQDEAGNTMFPAITKNYVPGTIYSIANPQREGYTSAPAVDGVVSNPHQQVVVIYAPKYHKITVKYMDDDTTPAPVANESVTFVAYGAEYTITPIEVEGYTTEATAETGTMGDSDVTITFTYTEDSGSDSEES